MKVTPKAPLMAVNAAKQSEVFGEEDMDKIAETGQVREGSWADLEAGRLTDWAGKVWSTPPSVCAGRPAHWRGRQTGWRHEPSLYHQDCKNLPGDRAGETAEAMEAGLPSPLIPLGLLIFGNNVIVFLLLLFLTLSSGVGGAEGHREAQGHTSSRGGRSSNQGLQGPGAFAGWTLGTSGCLKLCDMASWWRSRLPM